MDTNGVARAAACSSAVDSAEPTRGRAAVPLITSQPEMVALCYHDVFLREDRSRIVGVDERHYSVAADVLESHLSIVTGPLLKEGNDNPSSSRQRAVVFTFDDGWESAATIVAPLLERQNLRGAFFVTTGMVGCEGFLSREQVRSLHARGHLIGSHTHTHPDFIDRCERSAIRREWGTSVAMLQDVVGARVTAASVPSGAFSAQVAEIAHECGIDHLFTSRPALAPVRLGGIAVHGRFSITSQTAERNVRDYISIGPRRLRMMQAKWDLRRAASRFGGALWLAMRRAMLRATQ